MAKKKWQSGIFKKFGGKNMSAKSLYEHLDIDYLFQPIVSNYPGSRIYTQFNIDSNKFDVLIEYLGQTARLKFDISETEHRAGIESIISRITHTLEEIWRENMSAKSLWERFDIDDILQNIMSNNPGSRIFGNFDPDPNEFRVHIEYLGKVNNIVLDTSQLGHRDFIAELLYMVNKALRKIEIDAEHDTKNNTDSIFKRVFDICKTYDVSINIHTTTVSEDICCVRVLKDKQALDYIIDLGEIIQQKMPMDEAFITRIDMAAKELSNERGGIVK
jgi:hypothetical protein